MSAKSNFEGFILKNLDKSYRFAYTYVKNKEDAEDVVNESVLKALRAIDTLKDERYMKAWFYKIISNTAITYMNKKGRVIATEDKELEKIQMFEDKYDESGFEEMIKDLPSKYREVIVLRFFENMSLLEISDILDLNENTVKTRLYRGLKILKVDIEREVKWIS